MNKQAIVKEGLNNIKIIGGVILLAVAARAVANRLWTDQNSHDPGVTEMDLLAYTLDDEEGIDHRYYKQRKHKND